MTKPAQAPQIATPCVQLCKIEPTTRLCRGCLRSIDEITSWRRMEPAERTRVMAELPSRLSELAKAG